LKTLNDAPPNSLINNCESKGENNGRIRIWVQSLVYNTLGVEGRVRALRWGLRQVKSASIIHTNLHKLNNKLINA